jgi:uncharacterized protein YeaO (DUF488 family)
MESHIDVGEKDELRSRRSVLTALRRRARNGTVTLVDAARDEQHNDAAVLGEVLRRGLPRDCTHR